jgi:hypothetical protein
MISRPNLYNNLCTHTPLYLQTRRSLWRHLRPSGSPQKPAHRGTDPSAVHEMWANEAAAVVTFLAGRCKSTSPQGHTSEASGQSGCSGREKVYRNRAAQATFCPQSACESLCLFIPSRLSHSSVNRTSNKLRLQHTPVSPCLRCWCLGHSQCTPSH